MASKVVITFIILGALLFTNCSDDDTSTTPVEQESIQGSWNLKKVSGGLMGTSIDYDKGLVEWSFDTTTNRLTIINTILTTGTEDIYAGLDSGTYDYEIRLEENTITLFVNDTKQGALILSESALKIDNDIATDGLIKEFER